MSEATGAKKTERESKSESPLGCESSLGQGKDFYGPERQDNISGKHTTRLELWGEHLKDPIVALDKALKFVENPYQG